MAYKHRTLLKKKNVDKFIKESYIKKKKCCLSIQLLFQEKKTLNRIRKQVVYVIKCIFKIK